MDQRPRRLGEVLPDDGVEHDRRDAGPRIRQLLGQPVLDRRARDVDRDVARARSSASRSRCESLVLIGPDVREQGQRGLSGSAASIGSRSHPARVAMVAGVPSGGRRVRPEVDEAHRGVGITPAARRPARTGSGRPAGSGPRSHRARGAAAAARSRAATCEEPGHERRGAAHLVGLRRPGQRVEHLGRRRARARSRKCHHAAVGVTVATGRRVVTRELGRGHRRAPSGARRRAAGARARRRSARPARDSSTSHVGPPVSTSSAIRRSSSP